MSRPCLALLVAVLALLAAAPTAATAKSRSLDLDACPEAPAAQVFLPFLDPAHYVLARGGTFEGRLGRWELDRARVVEGNEPFYLQDDADEHALELRAGGEATSSRNCVSVARPTLRFVVRATGNPLAMLLVSAVREDGRALPIGVVSGMTRAWAPSLPMVIPDSLLSLTADGTADVRFRFTVLGQAGRFEVDDVYVDPYRKG